MYSVFDVLKYPNLAHLDPSIFPQVLEDKGGRLIIKTKKIVPFQNDGVVMGVDEETGKDTQYTRSMPGYVGLWFVFNWDNDLQYASLEGKYEISKVDSIAFLKVMYPGLNDYSIEYFMDLSSPIDKYLINTNSYQLGDVKSEFIEKRIDFDTSSRIISYEEMLRNQKEYPIPKKVIEALRRERLIGGVIYDKTAGVTKIEEVGVNGVVHDKPVLKYKGEQVDGILRKISLV